MSEKKSNRFFAKHAKSSALVMSISIHVLIIIAALSFVAVKVIIKDEQRFEVKEVKRPNMKLRQLQVPVNIKKAPQKPKLRKQIVAKPRLTQIADIKMPEIVGVKGGTGSGGGGFGGGASLGFSMPEINMFGLKGKGEKVFIILDSSPDMMGDEMGGIPAYTLIKEELVRVLGGLSPAALFNVAVYDVHKTKLCFPDMVAASAQNVDRVKEWLKPLNAVRREGGGKGFGIRTLGKEGVQSNDELAAGKIKQEKYWYHSAAVSMKQQADTIFLLTCFWGQQWHNVEEGNKGWHQTAAGRRWTEAYEEGKRRLAEENRKRAEEGRPPRVIQNNAWEMNRVYFPDIERPPQQKKYFYTANDFTDALLDIRKQYRSDAVQARRGARRKTSLSKNDFSFNVIHFRETGQSINTQRQESSEAKFKQLVSRCNGEYRTLAGLEAIRSSVQ